MNGAKVIILRRQKTEDRRQKTEDRRNESEGFKRE
jgi:hypothetical protein